MNSGGLAMNIKESTKISSQKQGMSINSEPRTSANQMRYQSGTATVNASQNGQQFSNGKQSHIKQQENEIKSLIQMQHVTAPTLSTEQNSI